MILRFSRKVTPDNCMWIKYNSSWYCMNKMTGKYVSFNSNLKMITGQQSVVSARGYERDSVTGPLFELDGPSLEWLK